MNRTFRKGEVVWAKVRGFPWWPGVVKRISLKVKRIPSPSELNEKELIAMIDFIGDNSHIELPLNKLEKFNCKYEEFSKTKNKALIKSIIVAKKIILGEIPFEKHIDYVKKKLDMSLHMSSLVESLKGEMKGKGGEVMEDAMIPLGCEPGKEVIRKRLLGLKRMRKAHPQDLKCKHCTFPPIDKQDYCKAKPKNIKINININVNNNSNNTLNITSFNNAEQCKKINKIIDDDIDDQYNLKPGTAISSLSNSNSSSDENISLKNIEAMKESLGNLLRYKIEMPTSTSNKYIITSLNQIEEQINSNKTCCTYKLTKELLPVLTSFLSNKNQEIFIKSSEILVLIKEKILNEIFEYNVNDFDFSSIGTKCGGDVSDIHEDIFKAIQDFHRSANRMDRRKHLLASDKPFSHDAFGMRYLRTTRKLSEEMRINHRNKIKHCDRENDSKKEKEKETTKIQEDEAEGEGEGFIDQDLNMIELNDQIKLNQDNTIASEDKVTMSYVMHPHPPCDFSNENNNTQCENLNLNINSNSNLFKKKIHKIANIKTLNSKDVNFLFNGFISEIDEEDIIENLQNGEYCNYFYQNIYNKFNGLEKKLANRRKHVCLKLLNIFKLILPEIDQEALKKAIVFLEYNIRTRDPTLGTKYKENIENFYDRIKEILNLTSDSLAQRSQNSHMSLKINS